MKFFDYIFFRVSKVYHKWDGRSGITGIMAITMMQSLLASELIIVILRCFYSRNDLKSLPIKLSYIAIIVCAIFLYLNTKRYYNKYNKYRFFWKFESTKLSQIRGVVVILSLILPMLFLYIINKYL